METKVEQITSRDGTTIGYWRSGVDPPLLLVHGTTADHRRWSTISSSLEQHFTVYAMDRRDRGGSGDSPRYDIRREAEDVAAVVEAIGCTRLPTVVNWKLHWKFLCEKL